MKIKLLLSLLVAGGLCASAQSQGYKDGIEYYKAGQYEDAKTILEKTINDASTDKALANYYLGQVDLATGDKAAAKKCFDAGIATNPECAYNYVGLGALELLSGNASAADENFKTAQKMDKKNYEILVDIARAYYNADPVKYAKEIEKYLAKAHKDSKNREPSIYILEGDMLFANEKYGEAAANYEMATGYDATNPEGYVKYAKAYFPVNPQFSIQKLEEFVGKAPESALGQRELAEALFKANYWKKAAEQYGRYIQNPNHFPKDKERYAVLLYHGEDYAGSLRVSDEVLAINPASFQAQRLHFINLNMLKRYQEAADYAPAYFAKNKPDLFREIDYTTYADALTNLGQDSLALVQYELAVQKFPESAGLLQELSNLYTKNKKYALAADTYAKYLSTQENPSANDLFNASGRYLNVAATAGDDMALRKEAGAKGLELVNKALEKAPGNTSVLQRKARLLIAANGNTPDQAAIDAYNEMLAELDKDPKNADAANPDNNLNMYREAYMFSVQYYDKVNPDKEKAAQISDLLRAVNEKLGK